MEMYFPVNPVRVIPTDRKLRMGNPSVFLLRKVKCEHILLQLPLIHEIVENGLHVLGSHLRVRQAQNAVEVHIAENDAVFRGDFSHVLSIDLEIRKPKRVAVNLSLQRTRPELHVQLHPLMVVVIRTYLYI